jgi:predicted acylesterase/phospholipase RssA
MEAAEHFWTLHHNSAHDLAIHGLGLPKDVDFELKYKLAKVAVSLQATGPIFSDRAIGRQQDGSLQPPDVTTLGILKTGKVWPPKNFVDNVANHFNNLCKVGLKPSIALRFVHRRFLDLYVTLFQYATGLLPHHSLEMIEKRKDKVIPVLLDVFVDIEKAILGLLHPVSSLSRPLVDNEISLTAAIIKDELVDDAADQLDRLENFMLNLEGTNLAMRCHNLPDDTHPAKCPNLAVLVSNLFSKELDRLTAETLSKGWQSHAKLALYFLSNANISLERASTQRSHKDSHHAASSSSSSSSSRVDPLPPKLFKPFRVCLICFIQRPAFVHPCGHNFCDYCMSRDQRHKFPIRTNAAGEKQPICFLCEQAYRHDPSAHISPPPPSRPYKTVPKYAGVRILALDGGGVKGIVSLTVLERLQHLCYDIPIVELFDMISGTSTGGILTVGLVIAGKSVKDLKQIYGDLASDVFRTSRNIIGDGYGSNKLKKHLIHFTGNQANLLERVMKNESGEVIIDTSTNRNHFLPQIVIPSSVEDPNHKLYDLQLHTSFIQFAKTGGEGGGGGSTHPSYLKAYEVCLASSAAPSFFPAFKDRSTKTRHLDGSLLANCPAVVALNQAAELWSTHKIDLVFSVGTGHVVADHKHRNSRINLIRFLERAVSQVTSSETIWRTIESNGYVKRGETCLVRVSPVQSRERKLSDYSSMDDMEEEATEDLAKPKVGHCPSQSYLDLKKMAARTLSSLFYLDNIFIAQNTNRVDFNSIRVTAKIKCRLADHLQTKEFLHKFSWRLALWPQSPFESHQMKFHTALQKEEDGAMDFEATLPKCAVAFAVFMKFCLNDDEPHLWEQHISGSPFYLNHGPYIAIVKPNY